MQSATSAPLERLFPDRYRYTGCLTETDRSLLLMGTDRERQAPVVIKCFRAEDREAFARERRCGLESRHPNLLGCYDTFYTTDAQRCLVFDYMAEGTLRDALTQAQPWDEHRALRCLRAISAGLADLHRRGWLHCDLKAENVFLHSDGSDPAAIDYRLGDFGACSRLDDAEARAFPFGTPAYLAPERHRGAFDVRSDLYSLGVLGFELVAGRLPYDGDLPVLRNAHRTGNADYAVLGTGAYRDLISWLMQPDPDRRPADTGLVLTVIDRMLDPERSAAPESAQDLTLLSAGTLAWKTPAGLRLRREDTATAERRDARITGAELIGAEAADELLFRTGEQIGALCTSSGERRVLVEGRGALLAAAACRPHLAWLEESGLYRASIVAGAAADIQLLAQDRFICDARNEAKLGVAADGRVAFSPGLRSDSVRLYSDAGSVQVVLPGQTLLGFFTPGAHLLALTLDTRAANLLQLWALEGTGAQRLDAGFSDCCWSPGTRTLVLLDDKRRSIRCLGAADARFELANPVPGELHRLTVGTDPLRLVAIPSVVCEPHQLIDFNTAQETQHE